MSSGGYEPWSFIIGQIVQGGARNMKETGQGAEKSEYGGYGKNLPKQEETTYGQAPQMASGAASPTMRLMNVVGVPDSVQKQVPGVGQALQGEETMLRNVTPAVGGFDSKPLYVDSRRPLYSSKQQSPFGWKY